MANPAATAGLPAARTEPAGDTGHGVPTSEDVRAVAAQVPDPEIPVITLEDLGVLRDVRVDESGHITVDLTPTYSGCPAMDVMRNDVRDRLAEHGWTDVDVRLVLAPAWTTDWMSEAGRQKLNEFGIAPPGKRQQSGPVPLRLSVRCPLCGSPNTEELSRFGSTACKALWRCRDCREPFDYFKAL